VAPRDLDHEFSWRWLLPDASRVHVAGFTPDEQAWWARELSPAAVVADPAGAELLLIRSDGLSFEEGRLAGAAHAHTVMATCTRSTAPAWRRALLRRFATISEYAVLPPGNPRLLLHLDGGHQVSRGMQLHRPGRLFRRWAFGGACWLARCGFRWPLKARTLLIAKADPDKGPRDLAGAPSVAAGGHSMPCAVYLGSPGPDRKTTVLPPAVGEPSWILKSAQSPGARASLRAENRVLGFLGGTVLNDQVPRVLKFTDDDRSTNLFLEHRPLRAGRPRSDDPGLVAFLRDMSGIHATTTPWREAAELPGVKPEQESEGSDPFAGIRDRVRIRLNAGIPVRRHLAHGDFTFWNCAQTSRGFFVFDWETGAADELAGADAFQYEIGPALAGAERASAPALLRRALGLAGRVIAASEDAGDSVRLHFALWALPRLRRHPLYGELLSALEADWK